MKREIAAQIQASIAVKEAVLKEETIIAQIQELVQKCLKSLTSGGKVIFAGNGGSFADAQHLSAEFTSRFLFDRAPLASIVLGANNSAISAISTSGNSANILAAVEHARLQGLDIMGLTGFDGGKLIGACNCICVPSSETARIQECHILIGHIICGLVEEKFFNLSP